MLKGSFPSAYEKLKNAAANSSILSTNIISLLPQQQQPPSPTSSFEDHEECSLFNKLARNPTLQEIQHAVEAFFPKNYKKGMMLQISSHPTSLVNFQKTLFNIHSYNMKLISFIQEPKENHVIIVSPIFIVKCLKGKYLIYQLKLLLLLK